MDGDDVLTSIYVHRPWIPGFFFLYGVENRALCFFLFVFFSTPSALPPDMGGACIAVLTFWGVGIGLLSWEAGGLGLSFFFLSHPLCSLSDHFLLLSVHKYKTKKKTKTYICINF